MTVAIGPKGSNLILGGKLAEVSAEQAYTVCGYHPRNDLRAKTRSFASLLPPLSLVPVLSMIAPTTS